MSADSNVQLSVRDLRVTRSFVAILGCLAIWWGTTEEPVFWKQSLVKGVANNILAGELFRNATLTGLLPIIEEIQSAAYCDPTALRSVVIIQLRMLDIELKTSNPKVFDINFPSVSNAIRRSLSCSPADSYMWLSLYQAESMRDGGKADDLKYLRMSYQLGPNEGWIAAKRNRLVFSNVDRLPVDLVDRSINELVALLNNRQFIDAAADVFVGPAWHVREKIIPRLSELSKPNRDLLEKILKSRGHDVSIPERAKESL